MELENPIDFNGSDVISKYDVLSDDLICHIKSLNPVLGTPEDPFYARYEQYRNELDSAELIIIDAVALNRFGTNNLDLSGSDDVDDLPSNFFQFILGTIEMAFGKDFDSINYKKNSYSGFEGFSEFNETEYTLLSSNYN